MSYFHTYINTHTHTHCIGFDSYGESNIFFVGSQNAVCFPIAKMCACMYNMFVCAIMYYHIIYKM